jgi:hypothetical protein
MPLRDQMGGEHDAAGLVAPSFVILRDCQQEFPPAAAQGKQTHAAASSRGARTESEPISTVSSTYPQHRPLIGMPRATRVSWSTAPST